MLRVLEGVIARRLLVNFRVDPEVARPLVPAPLEPLVLRGAAVAGLSLIRIEQLRPRGLAPLIGLALENAAHRFAIRAPGDDGHTVPGIYVARRDTESRLVATLGGPLFAGTNRLARFDVEEDPRRLRIALATDDGTADAEVEAEFGCAFAPTETFASLAEAQRFFQECERGFSGGGRAGELSMVRLKALPWRAEAVRLVAARARFFEDETRFPKGSVTLDGALAMRSLPAQWVEVRDVPEILEEPLLPQPA